MRFKAVQCSVQSVEGRISFAINETPCRQREREHPAPFRGLIREDNHQTGDDDDDGDDDDI